MRYIIQSFQYRPLPCHRKPVKVPWASHGQLIFQAHSQRYKLNTLYLRLELIHERCKQEENTLAALQIGTENTDTELQSLTSSFLTRKHIFYFIQSIYTNSSVNASIVY
jgi:hypothetical protein